MSFMGFLGFIKDKIVESPVTQFIVGGVTKIVKGVWNAGRQLVTTIVSEFTADPIAATSKIANSAISVAIGVVVGKVVAGFIKRKFMSPVVESQTTPYEAIHKIVGKKKKGNKEDKKKKKKKANYDYGMTANDVIENTMNNIDPDREKDRKAERKFAAYYNSHKVPVITPTEDDPYAGTGAAAANLIIALAGTRAA